MSNKFVKDDEDENKITFTESEDLFEDLGFSKQDSLKMQVKAELFARIIEIVRSSKFTQHQVSKILDIPQPRVSMLLTGKISNMTVDSLLEYAGKLDKKLRINFVADRRDVG